MPSLKERAKTLVELADAAEFLFTDGPRTLDEAAQKVLTPEARRAERRIPGAGRRDAPWTGAALEEKARAFADAKGLKLGQVAQPLRAALTGKTTSPPIFAMLEVLGTGGIRSPGSGLSLPSFRAAHRPAQKSR